MRKGLIAVVVACVLGLMVGCEDEESSVDVVDESVFPDAGEIPEEEGGGVPQEEGGEAAVEEGGGVPQEKGGEAAEEEGGGVPQEEGGEAAEEEGGGVPQEEGGEAAEEEGGGVPQEEGGEAAEEEGGGVPQEEGGEAAEEEGGGVPQEEGGEAAEEEGGEGAIQEAEWVPGDCNTAVFLDVDNSELYEGPGEGLGTPTLTAECTSTTMMIQSNGLPHYTYQAMTPNGLEAQNFNWEIPLEPTMLTEMSPIPCLGTVGFSVNGIPLYGPNEAAFPDPYGDPIANDVMDWCFGHTGGQADYHYHGLDESCLDKVEEGPSQLLGFAMDGYPIYGPRGCLDASCEEVVTFKSSYNAINYESVDCTNDTDCGSIYTCADAMIAGEQKRACVMKDYAWDNNAYEPVFGVEYLDECNGRVGPDGFYRYHATGTFPYILGCYRGQVLAGGGAANGGTCPTSDGTDSNGGGDGGQDPRGGATMCDSDADCVGECKGNGTGCVCNATPMGEKICVSTCEIDADCTTGMTGVQLTCNENGMCTPGGP